MTVVTKSRTVGNEKTSLTVGGIYPGFSLAIVEKDGFGNYQYSGDCSGDYNGDYCDGDCDESADMDFQTTVNARGNSGHLWLDISSGYVTKGGDRAGDLYDPPDMEEEDRDKDISVQIPADFLPLVIAELTRIQQQFSAQKTQQGG